MKARYEAFLSNQGNSQCQLIFEGDYKKYVDIQSYGGDVIMLQHSQTKAFLFADYTSKYNEVSFRNYDDTSEDYLVEHFSVGAL